MAGQSGGGVGKINSNSYAKSLTTPKKRDVENLRLRNGLWYALDRKIRCVILDRSFVAILKKLSPSNQHYEIVLISRNFHLHTYVYSLVVVDNLVKPG